MKQDDEDVEADSRADTDLKERKVNHEGNVMDEGDEMLRCRDCDKDFAFTVGEQEFFKQKGFDNKPSRCSECKVTSAYRLCCVQKRAGAYEVRVMNVPNALQETCKSALITC